MSYQMQDPDVASIRDWVVEKITLIADNNEPWYRALTHTAQAVGAEPFEYQDDDATTPRLDYGPAGEAVCERLRRLIEEDLGPRTITYDLLIDLLDLNDSRQAEMLGEHYLSD